MKNYISMGVLPVMLLLMAACTKTPEQLYEEQKSGVVMVINKHYYELRLPSGYTCYFSGLDEEGVLRDFTEDQEEIVQNSAVSFGTAFFVDDKGTLLTNRHVASPPIDKELVKENFAAIVSSVQAGIISEMDNLQSQLNEAQMELDMCTPYYDEYGYLIWSDGDEQRRQFYEDLVADLQRRYDEAQQGVINLELMKDPQSMEIVPVCELGIAFEGTTPQSETDFLKKHPCKVVRTSGNLEVDLALLKLKSGVTPANTYFFNPFEADDELAIGTPLYMIGYNAGVDLAYTKQGIQSQLTKGAVTQKPDGQRVLYDIATVQGSSGSPVLNDNGELVAVNFAKYVGSDNFNLGIPLSAIRKFLK